MSSRIVTNTHKPILVTGATGRHGGSGHAVALELLKLGVPVRALVRNIDARAEALRDRGVQLAVGDYGNYASLIAALEGVESAYFCYPVAAGINEAAGFFAAAGREQGLKRIVDLSLATTRKDSPSPQGRAQWVAEQIFEWVGFGGVHLRIAAFFMENVPLLDGWTIRNEGLIANPFGDKPLTWISAADVGALAAHLLVDGTQRERIILAGGVQRLTYREIAQTITSVTGKTVEYSEISPEVWGERLRAASKAAGEPVNERAIDHLIAQSIALKSAPPSPITDHVSVIVKRQPISFAEFVQNHITALTPQGD